MTAFDIEQALADAVQHHQASRLTEAEAIYRRILSRHPDHPDALHLLGVLAIQANRNDVALPLIRRALALRPDFAGAHNNLAKILADMGQLDEAIAHYEQALALSPHFLEAWISLAGTLTDAGRSEQAVAYCQRALALEPSSVEAHQNLGNALMKMGQLNDAIGCFQRALALRPDSAEVLNSLGAAYKGMGLVDDAIAVHRRAVALKPGDAALHSNLLVTLHYHAGCDARSIFNEHRRWDQQHAAPLRSLLRPHGNDRSPDRGLRIGYVSLDFRRHSVNYFVEPILACHDHDRFPIFCYADELWPDATTDRLRSYSDVWRNITGQHDQTVADMIRTDQIDILVDLAGHTGHNRLLVFARKPAPIQLTYLGYPDTTGLSVMDYRLTDAMADPPGMTESLHSEQLVRLLPCAWCFHPPQPCPSVSAAPALSRGQVTFGSFNILAKIGPPTIALWSQIMQALPDSRLVLKDKPLADARVGQRVRDAFAAHGIAADRIELLSYTTSYLDHLDLHSRMDIVLDPLTYNGTTTTCEALWMGAPVVSLAGQTHVSRVGVSLLSALGLSEWVADSPQDYVRVACTLGKDLPRLQHWRNTLRERMQNSPLMDAARFVRNLQAVYRTLWRQWCQRLSESQPGSP